MTPDKQRDKTRKKELVEHYGNMSMIEAAMKVPRSDLRLLAEIAEGESPKETPQSRTDRHRILEAAMGVDLKSDPLALLKLTRKWAKNER